MTQPRKRPVRKSLKQTGKLVFEERKGYQRRVFNDHDSRVEDAVANGWEVVRIPVDGSEKQAGDASQLGSVVRKPVGGGINGVLMEIPKEWYEQDKAEKERSRLAREEALLSDAPELSATDRININRPKPAGVTIE